MFRKLLANPSIQQNLLRKTPHYFFSINTNSNSPNKHFTLDFTIDKELLKSCEKDQLESLYEDLRILIDTQETKQVSVLINKT